MQITLPPVRYYTQADPYFYTVDNRPISDLDSGQQAIKAAFEGYTSDMTKSIVTGAWPLTVNLTTTLDRNNGFAIKLRTWATVDTAVQNPPVATYSEDVLIGYVSATGVVTISGITNLSKAAIGAGALSITATSSATDQITLKFSGYTGTRGLVNVKTERFGKS